MCVNAEVTESTYHPQTRTSSFNPLHAVMSSVILSSSDGPGLARRTTICRVGGIVVSRENPLQIREKMSCMGVERDEAVVDLVSVEGAGL